MMTTPENVWGAELATAEVDPEVRNDFDRRHRRCR